MGCGMEKRRDVVVRRRQVYTVDTSGLSSGAAAQEGRGCKVRRFLRSHSVTVEEGGTNGKGKRGLARVGNIKEAMTIQRTTNEHYSRFAHH